MITHLGGRPKGLFGGADELSPLAKVLLGLVALALLGLVVVVVTQQMTITSLVQKVKNGFANVGATIKDFMGYPDAYNRPYYQGNGGEDNNTSFMYGKLLGKKVSK
mgnify:CR=1 FL=1